MYYFSKRSKRNLQTCNIDLIILMSSVIKRIDFTVICGHRNKEDQNKAYDGGYSKLKFPKSSHNLLPSMACDIMPYPIPKNVADWNSPEYLQKYQDLAKIVKEEAKLLKINITWGGDWKKFVDLPHWQLNK